MKICQQRYYNGVKNMNKDRQAKMYTYWSWILSRTNSMSWCSWQIKCQSPVDWVQKEFMTRISHLWMWDKELRKSHATDQHASLRLALLYREMRNGTGGEGCGFSPLQKCVSEEWKTRASGDQYPPPLNTWYLWKCLSCTVSMNFCFRYRNNVEESIKPDR